MSPPARGRRLRPTIPGALALVVAALIGWALAACGTSTNLDAPACSSDDDCQVGLSCVEGRCVASDTALDMGGETETFIPCDGRCAPDETCCGDACLDLQSDPNNCGGCGAQCGANEACVDGACTCGDVQPGEGPACTVPFVCCGEGDSAACVNVLNDAAHCGECGISCGEDSACLFGGCQCPAGTDTCAGETCIDLLGDPANCGTCGNECGDQLCTDGRCTCGAVSCAADEACCDVGVGGEMRSTCVDEGSFATNPSHCGGCAGTDGQKCPPNHACEGGQCVCGNTGAACADGDVCCGGTECKPEAECLCGGSPCNQACCGTQCVDLDSDPTNCGGCGIACGAEQSCVAGECVCSDAALALCAGACVDVTTSTQHCGACGNTCAVGESCCSGSCTDTETSLLHCGGCGQTCSGVACLAGQCSCDGEMPTDLANDPQSCGDCSTSCVRAGASVDCVAGTCDFAAATCLGSSADCDGDIATNGCEVNLDSSATDCGACGNACAVGEACAEGTCIDPLAIVQVEVSRQSTCARRANGELLCWGEGGDGENALGGVDADTPQVVQGVTVVDICMGISHGCAVTTSGAVVCWGDDEKGPAAGPAGPHMTPNPIMLPGTAIDVTCGPGHSCAVLSTGSMMCWGDNGDAELGNGTQGTSATPVSVLNVSGIVAAAAGGRFTCAREDNGDLWCWGRDNNGTVLCATNTPQETPCKVAFTPPAPATPFRIHAGYRQVFAIDPANALWGWGEDKDSILLNQGPDPSVLITSVRDAAACHSEDTSSCGTACAIDDTGTTLCWGRDNGGSTGTGICCRIETPTPVQDMPAGIAATDVAVGAEHGCAALENGEVYCWGQDESGQLGNGPSGGGPRAFKVVGLP